MMPHTVRLRLLTAAAALALLALPARAEIDSSLWSGQRALDIIVQLLKFTPRSMETAGHQQTIDYIVAELKKTRFSPTIKTQRWVAHSAGRTMAMTNIIARLNPDNPRRMIVTTHYDSIIKAYRDAKHPDAPMPGANNSASGVAVLLETARVISALPDPPIGIDMIFFDGEEGAISMGAGDPNFKPVGSAHFADRLNEFYPNAKPEKAIDFDMVCDKDLHLQPEPSSIRSAPAEVKKFWDIGVKIAPNAFEHTPTPYSIEDDHSNLQAAGIPSFVVIDFDYEPYYNTLQDTPDKCSTQSLEAVGRTLLQYLYLP